MLNRERMSHFLLELRREKDLTQDDVAQAIEVSGSDVAKWEQGTKLPLTEKLLPLSELYGVSVNELLSGQRYVMDEPAPAEQDVSSNILEYANTDAAEQFKHTRREWLIAITGVLAFVIVACMIIDFLSVGSITWSGIAAVSIVFAWGIILPLFFKLTTPVMSSLIAFTILIVPYLFLLNLVIDANNILLNVAIPITVIALVYLWGLYFIYTRMHFSIWRFLAIVSIALAPVVLLINLVISMQFDVPLFTVWNILSVVILIAIGAGLIYWEREKIKKNSADSTAVKNNQK